MSAVRAPVAAGTFYPGAASELGSTVDALLEDAAPPAGTVTPSAIVVPHAGYVYSGPVAASAFALLRGLEPPRVAILGPAHFVPVRGTVVPAAEAWQTPLGDVRIDGELRELAVTSGSSVDDAPHEPEHSLEVQLPFLQRIVGDQLAVLPIAVGASRAVEVGELVEALAPSALVVVSTDLSHYHDDATAKRLDRRTADAVVARDPDVIGARDACGAHALRGVVAFARRADLSIRLLDLRTSADTAGDPGRVVGYGAFVVEEAA